MPKNRYSLPETSKKVELFKGAQFNIAELAEQLKKSKSFSKLFEISKLDSHIKRPLLPLNIGQAGLIGGSGLINGLVESDTPHIIKGRIIKQKIVSEEENTNERGETMSTTVYETKTNKMVFNILTSEGFKSLSYESCLAVYHQHNPQTVFALLLMLRSLFSFYSSSPNLFLKQNYDCYCNPRHCIPPFS